MPEKSPSLQLGTQNLITDVTGLKVGQAEDDTLLSGVTVITADAPFTAACQVMGGAPGTRETDLLSPEMLVNQIDALVLSGGSAFGLSAASGVCDIMARQKRGYAIAGQHVPIVPAAILFDLANGGDKNWIENPYYQLGINAYQGCGPSFALGSFGAGKGAMAGTSKGGIGSASITVELPDGISFTIGALAAVNSFGSPFVPGSDKFWAAPFEVGDEFGGRGILSPPDPLALPITKTGFSQTDSRANTTIAVIATDLVLTKAEAQRLAITAHDGFARALVPSHCLVDGDIVFSVSTGEKEYPLTPAIQIVLGHVGAVTMARAIARGVYHAS
jgi:D-aminopeptidase